MDDAKFERCKQKGDKFEDDVLPLLLRYYAQIDPNAQIFVCANAKNNKENRRGPVWISASNPSVTAAAPDFTVFCNGKRILIDAKWKSSLYRDSGNDYGVVDEYKFKRDYFPSKIYSEAEAVYMVFGCGATRRAYLTRVERPDTIVRIGWWKVPYWHNQMYCAWDVKNMIDLGEY